MASPLDGIDARIAAATAAAEFDALGDLCERGGGAEPARALELADRLRARAREASSPFGEARALRASVAACAYAGRLDEAVARADEARAIAAQAGESVEHARAGVASMHALAKLGRLDEAVARGTAARDALRTAGRDDLAARAELNLANIHKIRGENDAALACLERARTGVPERDAAARGTIENTIGETLLQLDRFAEARAAFDRAESMLEAMPLARAIVVGNRADLAAREGAFGEALRDFDRASELVRDIAPGHHARLLLERGEALARIGAVDEAVETVERALRATTSRGLRAEELRGLLVRAECASAAARLDDAERDALRADAIARELGDGRAIRRASGLRADLALARGDAARARALAASSGEGASPLDAALAATRGARAELASGAADAAVRLASDARASASALGVATVEADACISLADANRALGRPSEAIAALDRAVELAERTRGTLAAERHRVAFGASRLRAYEDLALDLLARGDDASLARAFDVVERARSRSLLDAVLRAVDRDPGARAADSALASLRTRLSALHAAIDRGATGERRSADPARLASIREVEREIDGILAKAAIAHGAGALFAPTVPLDAVAASLGDGDALLSYFAAGDELMAFVVTRRATRCVRALVPCSELDRIVEKFLFAMRDGTRRGGTPRERVARALAFEIHRLVVQPLLDALEGFAPRRLVIAPYGALHAVPFAALWDGERFLVERYELLSTPSASIAATAAKRVAPAGRRAVVVSVADADAPLIAEESRAVARTLEAAGFCVELLAAGDATRARVAAAVRGAEIVHLACHGRFVSRLPAASGLLLADGWMPVRELVELELSGATVVLSGCETGRHAVEAGDELAGIARALLAAGARTVLTSLWSVRDAAAAPIATAFHDGLAGGLEPSAALRRSVLASLPDADHPSWWSPFTVMGAL